MRSSSTLLRPTFVAFDVSNDSRRNQLRLLLGLHGDWLQRSVWVLLPTTAKGALTVASQARQIVSTGDRVVVVRPCLGCLAEVRTVTAVRTSASAAESALARVR